MNISDEMREELGRAYKGAVSLTSAIKALLYDADQWEKEDVSDRVEWLFRKIFSLNNDFVSIGNSINSTENFGKTIDKFSQKIESEFDKKISVSFENGDVFHAVFATPPILKKRVAKASFVDSFSIPLQKKIVSAMPDAFEKYDSAYVIYVNHWEKDGAKTPYYDNDNIAIKVILDAVVPYICIDDSIHYCENLYLTVNDSQPISEIYIVKKGCLRAWIEQHKDILFVSEILSSLP